MEDTGEEARSPPVNGESRAGTCCLPTSTRAKDADTVEDSTTNCGGKAPTVETGAELDITSAIKGPCPVSHTGDSVPVANVTSDAGWDVSQDAMEPSQTDACQPSVGSTADNRGEDTTKAVGEMEANPNRDVHCDIVPYELPQTPTRGPQPEEDGDEENDTTVHDTQNNLSVTDSVCHDNKADACPETDDVTPSGEDNPLVARAEQTQTKEADRDVAPDGRTAAGDDISINHGEDEKDRTTGAQGDSVARGDGEKDLMSDSEVRDVSSQVAHSDGNSTGPHKVVMDTRDVKTDPLDVGEGTVKVTEEEVTRGTDEVKSDTPEVAEETEEVPVSQEIKGLVVNTDCCDQQQSSSPSVPDEKCPDMNLVEAKGQAGYKPASLLSSDDKSSTLNGANSLDATDTMPPPAVDNDKGGDNRPRTHPSDRSELMTDTEVKCEVIHADPGRQEAGETSCHDTASTVKSHPGAGQPAPSSIALGTTADSLEAAGSREVSETVSSFSYSAMTSPSEGSVTLDSPSFSSVEGPVPGEGDSSSRSDPEGLTSPDISASESPEDTSSDVLPATRAAEESTADQNQPRMSPSDSVVNNAAEAGACDEKTTLGATIEPTNTDARTAPTGSVISQHTLAKLEEGGNNNSSLTTDVAQCQHVAAASTSPTADGGRHHAGVGSVCPEASHPAKPVPVTHSDTDIPDLLHDEAVGRTEGGTEGREEQLTGEGGVDKHVHSPGESVATAEKSAEVDEELVIPSGEEGTPEQGVQVTHAVKDKVSPSVLPVDTTTAPADGEEGRGDRRTVVVDASPDTSPARSEPSVRSTSPSTSGAPAAPTKGVSGVEVSSRADPYSVALDDALGPGSVNASFNTSFLSTTDASTDPDHTDIESANMDDDEEAGMATEEEESPASTGDASSPTIAKVAAEGVVSPLTEDSGRQQEEKKVIKGSDLSQAGSTVLAGEVTKAELGTNTDHPQQHKLSSPTSNEAANREDDSAPQQVTVAGNAALASSQAGDNKERSATCQTAGPTTTEPPSGSVGADAVAANEHRQKEDQSGVDEKGHDETSTVTPTDVSGAGADVTASVKTTVEVKPGGAGDENAPQVCGTSATVEGASAAEKQTSTSLTDAPGKDRADKSSSPSQGAAPKARDIPIIVLTTGDGSDDIDSAKLRERKGPDSKDKESSAMAAPKSSVVMRKKPGVRQAPKSVEKDVQLQQKIDHEIKMRDGTAKLLAASKHPSQLLEAAKNLLTSNSRMIAYMSELQRRKTDEVLNRRKSDGSSKVPCKAKVAVSDIRIPLMWKDSDHFKSKGDHRRFAVFCVLKIGTHIYDTTLIKDVDSSLTDLTFEDVIVFEDTAPDFECHIEVYCHKLSDDSSTSTPRRIRKKFNEISTSVGRSVGRRLSGLKDDPEFMANMIVGPRFEMIASATLSLADVRDSIGIFDLPTNSAASSEGGSTELPLFGNLCCRLAAQPRCMMVEAAAGQVALKAGGDSWRRQQWCVLGGQSLRLWESERDQKQDVDHTLDVTITSDAKAKKLDGRSEYGYAVQLSAWSNGRKRNFQLAVDCEGDRDVWYNTLQQQIIDIGAWKQACDRVMSIEQTTPPNRRSIFSHRMRSSLYDETPWDEDDSPMTRVLNRLELEDESHT